MAEQSKRSSGPGREVVEPSVLTGITGALPAGERPMATAVSPDQALAAAKSAMAGATEANQDLAKALRSLGN